MPPERGRPVVLPVAARALLAIHLRPQQQVRRACVHGGMRGPFAVDAGIERHIDHLLLERETRVGDGYRRMPIAEPAQDPGRYKQEAQQQP